jgi:hypothetical protein
MKQLLWLSLILISLTSHSATLRGQNSYWQCSSSDSSHKSWDYSSSYKRKAINFSYKLCKQKSKKPKSCFTSHENCKMIINGKVLNNRWQCMALDTGTGNYKSDYFSSRNDAADGAKLLCKKISPFPSTCYVRLSTCSNKAL